MKTIQVNGGDCFHIAAQYLNDATQAYRIMQANSLSDPLIYSLMTLVIPDPDPTQTTGLPPQ